MVHKMNLNEAPFELIREGKKDIELRLNDEKRRAVCPDDIIEFRSLASGELLRCRVVCVHRYKSFDELYSRFDKLRLGYTAAEVADPSDMLEYYSEEKIAEYGACGIEIRLI